MNYSNPVGIVDRLGNRHPRKATESAIWLSTQSVKKISTRNAAVAALRLDPRTPLTPCIADILEAANRVAPAIPSIEPKLPSPFPSLRTFGKEIGEVQEHENALTGRGGATWRFQLMLIKA